MAVSLTAGKTIFPETGSFRPVWREVFFQSGVVRKMVEGKELNSWSTYHGMGMPRGRVGSNPAESVGLPGPPMTPAERRIAGSTAPKTDDVQRICWNYNSHIGCSDTGRTRAHTFYKNYDALTTAVRIALVKRYGFKKRNKLPVTQIAETISELRKTAHAELDIRLGSPAARGGDNPNVVPTLRVAGNPNNNPIELDNLDYLDSEEQLRRNLHGANPLFGKTLPHDEDQAAGRRARAT